MTQAKYLHAKNILPFASFIYFSNEKNFYLNDFINQPYDILKLNDYTESNIIFFRPGEQQQLDNLNQSKESINFWKKIYNNIDKRKLFINKTKFDEIQTKENANTF